MKHSSSCFIYYVSALFADDTNLTVNGATSHYIVMELEKYLSNVHNLLLANKLTLNINNNCT